MLQNLFKRPYLIVGMLFVGIAAQTFGSWAHQRGVKNAFGEVYQGATSGVYNGYEASKHAARDSYQYVGKWASQSIGYDQYGKN